MIDPKELRIGNVIKDGRKAKDWRFVTHRIISDLASNPGVDLYHAVDLTEEWLIKFGFTANIISYYKDISYFPKRIFKTLCVYGSTGISIREGELDAPRENDVLITLWNVDIHGPLYVHKLQNVFHALTGEELTIKE